MTHRKHLSMIWKLEEKGPFTKRGHIYLKDHPL
jgi:hypothetical protein